MSFNTFCNICLVKENIIKLCWDENEPLLNILISFSTCGDRIHGIIYLCINCCNKLEEYHKFRELYLTNFVRFRYLYNKHKKQLEIRNAPDIEKRLKTFIDINVERPSGTPLIENYEAAHDLRTDTSCNVEITCKESDEDFSKTHLDELLNKNDVNDVDTSFGLENNISQTEIHTCYVKYENDFFNENQENIYGISVGKHEPNQDLFEESQDPLVNDTVANVIPYPESADFVTDDSTDDKGSTDDGNKTTISDVVCNVCDETFSCKSDLEIHMRTHTGEKHNCDKCQKTFTDTDKLMKHKRFHCGKKPYKCDDCGLRYTLRRNLTRHKHIHTEEKPYKCDECGLRFAQRSRLNIHIRIHTGEKPYKCDECGVGFKQKSYLKVHKLIHTGEKPYKCDECGLKFIQKCQLTAHKRIHTGEKPFKCDECGFRFSRRANLNIHMHAHTGYKPYKCDECGLGFTRLDHVNRHKLTHTGEKPHKCDECGLRYTRLSDLNRHKLTHTDKKPYKCDGCGS